MRIQSYARGRCKTSEIFFRRISMSLDSDVIVDRRRIRRKLTFWRVAAALVAIAAIVIFVVIASVRHDTPPPALLARGGRFGRDRGHCHRRRDRYGGARLTGDGWLDRTHQYRG